MSAITQSFSQLLLTYGPGAMLDLPDHAVVVAGLEDWRYAGELPSIAEERLKRLLIEQLGDKLSPHFNGLRKPPAFDEDRHDPRAPGVETRVFPAWFLADEGPAFGGGAAGNALAEKRRRMIPFDLLSATKEGRLSYAGDGGKVGVNPVRFVGACRKGHLQDLDWRRLAHRGADQACQRALHWVERGVSSDPGDISVRCGCGAGVTLGDLYKPGFLGPCACESPWLTPRRKAGETCAAELHLLPRSATNTYFAQTVSVISLAESDDAARRAVAGLRPDIDPIRDLPNFLDVLRRFPKTREGLKTFSDEEILRALDDDAGVGDAQNPRVAEFDLLACGNARIGTDREGSHLFAETLDRSALHLPAPYDDAIQNIVKVHRLREVVCLYGFTRLEPPPTAAESDLDDIQLAVDGADLARAVEWLPAVEQFGEGIFLHFAPTFVNGWLHLTTVSERAAELKRRETAEAERTKRPAVHLGAAYWALHSLSHAFMSELALECGYPLSSLKERIYASTEGRADRFGFLIYTSTAGGQGTLGGLSNMASRVGGVLDRVRSKLELCSNDPICAEHSFASDDRPLHGAACHGCLLIPETACEARNGRLDRTLLVSTILQRRSTFLCAGVD